MEKKKSFSLITRIHEKIGTCYKRGGWWAVGKKQSTAKSRIEPKTTRGKGGECGGGVGEGGYENDQQ